MFTNKLKTGLAIAVSIITVVGAVWLVGNTFATNERVDKEDIKIIKSVDTKMDNIEIVVAGALQRQQVQSEKRHQNQEIKSDYRFYQFMHDKLVQEKMEIRRQLRRDPNNQGLRQDYIELEEERKRIKQKMDELMEKIN